MFNENDRVKKIDQLVVFTIEFQILITNLIYTACLSLGDKHLVGFETIYFDFARARVDLEPRNLGFPRARVDPDPENFGFPRARVDLDPENSRRF